jgi:hypothetical protein
VGIVPARTVESSGVIAVTIAGVGLATAQGGRRELFAAGQLVPPAPTPWPPGERAGCQVHRPARGLDPALIGKHRLAALARAALDDLEGPIHADARLVLGSCNGGAAAWDAEGWRTSFDLTGALAGTPWAGQRLPVCSAACASGLHALHLGTRLLAAGAPEVVVLALDLLSAPSHESFETLRILASSAAQALPPWHPGRDGFVLGEAAVALRLQPATTEGTAFALALGHDLQGSDGLVRLLPALPLQAPALVLGQGTGPAAVDGAELAAIASAVPGPVPVASALHHFGHTLGASGLLSVALAALACRAPLPRALDLSGGRAADGRLRASGSVRSLETLVVCRALGGACAVGLAGAGRAFAGPEPRWYEPSPPPPLRDRVLRRLVAEAAAHRPARPPELLLICLEAPLLPPEEAFVGGRLLPSGVLEMTPGFVGQLVARAWGFAGPALCMVGDQDSASAVLELVRAARAAGDEVFRIDLRGKEEDRELVWNA